MDETTNTTAVDAARTIKETLGISMNVAKELGILADNDVELVVQSSYTSTGLGECEARIIDARIKGIEEQFNKLVDYLNHK